jgi:hypothetical protein
MKIRYFSIALTASILALTTTTQLGSIAQPIQQHNRIAKGENQRTTDRQQKAEFYYGRATKRYGKNDKKGAIADYS